MTVAYRRKIVASTSCPGCNASPGDRCTTATGNPTKLHILRINAAKRAATPGPCPTGCGLDLVVWRHQIIHHGGTHTFDCETATPTPEKS